MCLTQKIAVHAAPESAVVGICWSLIIGPRVKFRGCASSAPSKGNLYLVLHSYFETRPTWHGYQEYTYLFYIHWWFTKLFNCFVKVKVQLNMTSRNQKLSKMKGCNKTLSNKYFEEEKTSSREKFMCLTFQVKRGRAKIAWNTTLKTNSMKPCFCALYILTFKPKILQREYC